jgi:DNA-binding transcriptional regulator YiaG
LANYLGYDPFTNPALGSPKGNESSDVALLSSGERLTLGEQIRKRRLELRKTGTQSASDLGVSIKTLRDWETGRRSPLRRLQARVDEFLK